MFQVNTIQTPNEWILYSAIHTPSTTELRAKQYESFQNVFSSPFQKQTLDPFILESRIGCESSRGQVFHLKCKDETMSCSSVSCALKIMPRFRKNDSEINIAEFLSDKVLRGECSCFPVVYGKGFCPKTVFSDAEFDKNVREWMKAKKEEKHTYDVNDDIESDILLSEIFASDLRVFISNLKKVNFTSQQWILMLNQLFQALSILQRYNIVHNDLHTGNVLVGLSKENKEIHIAIHDFGESYVVEKWTTEERMKDIEILMNDLESRQERIPRDVYDMLFKLDKGSLKSYVLKYKKEKRTDEFSFTFIES